ncbi:hypothetical protein [Acidisphaera sp. S103]|uniref:hypothetical protein n=1 Tax=Acidisphaera sp. S103 TaxID=1747223 RepID=UPI00131EC8DC|nr:hypothetical protein [Acidisphaera sp. S103]
MTTDVHFVQGGDEPVLAGVGGGTLSCACGHTLIAGYDADRVLGIGIQCARCGTVTTTPQMAQGALSPPAVLIAAPSTEPRTVPMTVAQGITVIGQAEMDRLSALFRPVTPTDNTYRISPERLDEVAAAYERHVGDKLPAVAMDPNEPFRGLRDHALGWAVEHLRAETRDPAWAGIQNDVTAMAALHVAGFLHFVATWSHHPRFPAMAATAADRGCSLHGLATFAAAHSLNMMGNRLIFPPPQGYPGRIETFALLTGSANALPVHVDTFDRFEFPFGQRWDHANLRTAVSAAIEAAQGRINLRNPGLLLLSPGSALGGYDAALHQAIEAAMLSVGRKNRGLMAVGSILLRQQPTPDPAAVRFGYGLIPVANRRYQGQTQIRAS